MAMAFVTSLRSIDPSVKHGCILVGENNRVFSVGYNGPIHGIDDSVVPLERPHRYHWFLHSEENAVIFCTKDLAGATAYVTGRPCSRCTRILIQKGIKRIVYGAAESKCLTGETGQEDLAASDEMLKYKDVELIEHKGKPSKLLKHAADLTAKLGL